MVGPRRPDSTSRHAGDEPPPSVASALSRFVPAAVARRAIVVSVGTDREVYDRGDPVAVTVEFANRLPVGVEVPTPGHRPWGWSVGGELEATDERRYVPDRPSTFSFRAGERKRISFTWSGRFERTGDPHEFVLPDPGEYELRAFVATHEGTHRPSDATTIEIR